VADTKPDPQATSRPDLLERDFTAARPNQRWVADLTYLRCFEGVPYFAFILDVYSRTIVGWQTAGHMRDTLVIDALEMAVAARHPDPDLELLHRSDRGSQYSSGDFTDALDDHDILASVGSVGDAYDNAMAESFVDTLKTELITDRRWRTRGQLELALVQWVGWYNHQRLHSELGDVPPVEFEFAHQLQTPVFRRSRRAALRAAPRDRGAGRADPGSHELSINNPTRTPPSNPVRLNVAYRVVTANVVPDHATIARFLCRHEAALAGLFASVLRLCAKAGLAQSGLVAIDGTKVLANANRDQNVDYERIAREILEEAKAIDAGRG
jgi:transposase InsO family protein